jgi:hypothetical protein
MGEAKRRQLLDPTFGKNKLETIALQLRSSLAAFQEEHGRGFFLSTSESDNLTYIRDSELDAQDGLKELLSESAQIGVGRLLGMLQSYDHTRSGIHLHFDGEEFSLVEFPLSLMDGSGKFDERALAIAGRFLSLVGARVVEIKN